MDVGDRIKDNDPRRKFKRVLVISELFPYGVRAKDSSGRAFIILKRRIHSDGKPRRTGFDLVPPGQAHKDALLKAVRRMLGTRDLGFFPFQDGWHTRQCGSVQDRGNPRPCDCLVGDLRAVLAAFEASPTAPQGPAAREAAWVEVDQSLPYCSGCRSYGFGNYCPECGARMANVDEFKGNALCQLPSASPPG